VMMTAVINDQHDGCQRQSQADQCCAGHPPERQCAFHRDWSSAFPGPPNGLAEPGL